MTPTLHIQLLGSFRLTADQTPVTTLDSPRIQALLAYLLVQRAAPHARASLAFQLWPDTTEAQAHANLRTLLHRFRHALPDADEFLHIGAQTVQWRPDAPYTLDVADVERALAQAEAADRAGDQATMCTALRGAAERYRGDLLPALYDDWVLVERERLRQAFLVALERLVLLLEQQPDYPAAIGYAQRLLRHDPLHEAAYQHLMRLHAARGDRASAVRVYHTCATLLERELAVAPSPATCAIFERLLHGDLLPTLPPPEPANKRPVQMDAPILRDPPPPTRIGIAPLVGRQREWAQVQATWQATATSGPHMLVLAGEAGIGKTRLAEELLAWGGRLGVVTASARCYAAEGGLVYAPVTGWLRTEAIRATMPALADIWLTDIARLLPELLAERPELPRPGLLTEAWQRQRLFEALARATLGDGQPRLLLLDDLQWCDQETLAWLHYLLRIDPQAQLLLIGTVRPEELIPDHPLTPLLHAVRRSGQVTEIALGPLDAAATAALAAHLTDRDLDPAVAAALHEETEGNPLFVVETVRAGAMAQTERAQHAVSDTTGPPDPALPPAVQAVIAARLAQLSPPARELVGVAATIGRAFTFPVLAGASEADEPTLVRGLDELWQRRLVREQGEDAYDFSHDKLREAAYAELSAARRRLLHRRVAEAVEAVHARDLTAASAHAGADDEQPAAAQLTPLYPLLAYHWRQAGHQTKTMDYLAKAGEQALHSYANQEAVRLVGEALTLAAQSERGDDRWQCARWERQLGEAYYGLGRLGESRAHLERATALLGWPVPSKRGRLVVSLLGQILRQALHRAWPARFIGHARTLRAAWLAGARTYDRLAQLAYFAGETIPMIYMTIRGLNLAEAAGPSSELARLYATMSMAAGLAPLHKVAEAYGRRAQEMAQNAGGRTDVAWVLEVAGVYRLGVGQWAKAEDALSQAADIADRLGDQRRCEESLTLVPMVHYYQGAFARSAELFSRSYASTRRSDDPQLHRLRLIGHGMAAFRLGQMDTTIGLLEAAAALPTTSEPMDRAAEIPHYGLLAVVRLRSGEEQLALQAAETAAQRIAQSRPTLNTFFEGCASVAEVYLALWEADNGQPPAERTVLAQRARRACHDLRRYAHVFPIGQPRAWLWQGLYEWLAGKPGKARKAWHKSLAAAERLAMLYEQGLAHYEIGRHASLPERQHHLARACAIFAQLGTAYELARAETAATHTEPTTAKG